MKTFIFLCCTAVFSLTTDVAMSQNAKIKIKEDTTITVDEVFDLIVKQTNYDFFYEEGIFKHLPNVKLKKGAISLYKLLDMSLSTSGYQVVFTVNNGVIVKQQQSNSREHVVQGQVTDQNGIPLLGVTVLIKGMSRGTITNEDGMYKIRVPNPENVLQFTYLGFETVEVLVGNQTTINVTLKESISALDEVVINAGYYNTTQKKVTGSISRIDAKTIERQVVNNPLAAMQGYMPGINITQEGGDAGSGFRVQIRGRSFIEGSNEPLYIIDGVPYLGADDVESSINGIAFAGRVSPLNLMDPNSIESIEVLKDADATAIYGSKGANGVVLITTKKGKAGKTQVRFNVSTSMASVQRFVDLLDTQEYLDVRYQVMQNSGWSTPEDIDGVYQSGFIDVREWDQDRYTDWQEVLIGGTAFDTRANLEFSGGSENTRFLVGGSYQKSSTVYIGDSGYKKANVNANINHQSSDNRFKLNTNIAYGSDISDLPFGISSMTALAYRLAPNAPSMYDENGNLSWEGWTRDQLNPLAKLEGKFEFEGSNLQFNQTLSYELVKNLQVSTNIGYTKYEYNTFYAEPNTLYPPDSNSGESPAQSRAAFADFSRNSWIIEPQVNYKKQWGKLSINGLIGGSFQQNESNYQRINVRGFLSNSQISNLAAAIDVTGTATTESVYKYAAAYGRLNLDWDNTLLLNVTGRRDGSSRFGPGKQFGTFGAIGAAWVFSKLPMFQDSKLLSFGKLRSSYGITGSDNVDDYEYYDTYQLENNTGYNGTGLFTTRLYNPNFAWQTNKKFEVALELGVLKDRIFLITSYWQNRSSNQLVSEPLPTTTGFNEATTNFDALVQNSGLEIDLKTTNIQNDALTWTTTFNLSLDRSKLVKFDNLENSAYRHQYVVGQPLSIRKLYRFTGVDPDTGNFSYEDFNNDGVINDFDRQVIADFTPEFYGGLGNNFNYKNWNLDIFFQFKKHRIKQFVNSAPGIMAQNIASETLNSPLWQDVIANLSMLNLDSNASGRFGDSDIAYTDGSFIRLRNVNLTYTLPQSLGFTASVFFQAQNLLTFTKFKGPDPDHFSNDQLPALRQFTVGMNLKF